MRSKGILLIISGFAGAGKGTVVRELISRYDNYALSVSATTRAPREGEENGVHYFFKTKEEFERMIGEDQFLEYANYVTNYYGTPRAYVEEKLNEGKDVILEIEMQGAMDIKAKYPDTLLMFLTTPDADSLEGRLRGRGTETDEVVRKRLARAVEEAEGICQYDYIVVNDDLETCINDVHNIIHYEHYKVARNMEEINVLKQDLSKFRL